MTSNQMELNKPLPDFQWVDALQPEVEPFPIWYIQLGFEKWIQPEGAPKLAWEDTYGKKQVVGADNERSVVEVEVVRRMRKAGYQAFWLDAFGRGPLAWHQWITQLDKLPEEIQDLVRRIGCRLGSRVGGIPDVVAWLPGTANQALFIECKGKGDNLRSSQLSWFRAALEEGLPVSSYVVANCKILS